jgi:hypothetical protein
MVEGQEVGAASLSTACAQRGVQCACPAQGAAIGRLPAADVAACTAWGVKSLKENRLDRREWDVELQI